MLCACIDIGSNTTRLLVADVEGDQVREVLQKRVFTRIGKDLKAHGRLSQGKIAEVAGVVADYRRTADALGVASLRTVATAAIRTADNREELVEALRARAGVAAHVLDGAQEARLAFLGATRTFGGDLGGIVAVVDVGGGSTELALGTLDGGVTWSESFRIGSGFLADAYLRSDPPTAAELHAAREHACGTFEGLELPVPARSVAVGGSATSLRRLVGAVLEPETIQRAMRVLSLEPCEQVAARFGLDSERVRLLPAGILILDAASHQLGCALQIGRGGLREGVCIELAAGARAERT